MYAYVCAVYDSCVLVGKISRANKDRVEQSIEQMDGPEGEQLVEWMIGSGNELIACYPQHIDDAVIERADEAYRKNPKNQVLVERSDV